MQTLSKAALLDPPTDDPTEPPAGPDVTEHCPSCGDVSRGICAACQEWDGVLISTAPPALIHDFAAVCHGVLRGDAMTAELRRVLGRYAAEFNPARIRAARARCSETAANIDQACGF